MKMKNPAHPGLLVKECLDDLGFSVAEASPALGISRQQLHRVVSGNSSITPEMALRFEKAFSSTARTWLQMQLNFDLAQARKQAPPLAVKKLVPKGTPPQGEQRDNPDLPKEEPEELTLEMLEEPPVQGPYTAMACPLPLNPSCELLEAARENVLDFLDYESTPLVGSWDRLANNLYEGVQKLFEITILLHNARAEIVRKDRSNAPLFPDDGIPF